MTELDALRGLLIVSVVVAPLSTRLFGELPRGWFHAHALGIASVAAGSFASPWLCVLWPVFCLGNFAAFLKPRISTLRTLTGIASCVPFAFSLVAATWIVGGTIDLGILGYGPHFSYYAALHGNVLGWTLVGAIAALATRQRRFQKLYLAAVFACFASFLLIAFGIDRLALLKPIGVAGLTFFVPAAQLAFLIETRKGNEAAFAAALVSVIALAFTFVLAWLNELGAPSLDPIGSVRSMVSIHGVINAVVVAPAFLLAVALDARAPQPDHSLGVAETSTHKQAASRSAVVS